MVQQTESKLVLCDRCKKLVPVSEVRYVPVGREFIKVLCKSCRSGRPTPLPEKKQPPKKVYFCSRCRYNFRFDPEGNTILRCPFCGKADKVSEKKDIEAEKLLKDSDELL